MGHRQSQNQQDRKASGTLTPKQQRFVAEYLLDLNATQAAIRAGYSEKTANEQGARLLVNVSIAAAIREGQEKQAERTEITSDWVVEKIRENVERAMQARPVIDEDGKPTGVWVYNGAVANKGLELLGRHTSAFDRPVRLPLAKVSTAADAMRASAIVVAEMAAGRITPAEAQAVSAVLEANRKMVETADIDARLSRIEQRLAKP
jgi:phage terminase small subunit